MISLDILATLSANIWVIYKTTSVRDIIAHYGKTRISETDGFCLYLS